MALREKLLLLRYMGFLNKMNVRKVRGIKINQNTLLGMKSDESLDKAKMHDMAGNSTLVIKKTFLLASLERTIS